MNPSLEMKANTTRAGSYTVTYSYIKAPLDVQEATSTSWGFEIVSPAQFGFLHATQPKGVATFNVYSRTSTDVFYDDRGDLQVVILPDRAISKHVNLADLVAAHRRSREYAIPGDQRYQVYGIVDEMLGKGTAFATHHGTMDVKTSELGQVELLSKLFSDERLGIRAQDYGNWLHHQRQRVITLRFNGRDYAKLQKGPYLSRLRVCGSEQDFDVIGYRGLYTNYGAFAVNFKKTEEGSAKKQ